MGKSILLVDDEPDCFEIIKHYINSKRPDIHVFYAPHVEYAMEYMKARMRSKSGLYAIVCDNHLANEDNPNTLDGDEFLRAIRGYPNSDTSLIQKFSDVRDRKIRSFLKANFMTFEEYQQIVNYYFGERADELLVMIVCGAPDEVNRTGIEDVPVFLKSDNGCRKLARELLGEI